MKAEAPARFAQLSSCAFWMAAIAGFTDVFAFVSLDKLFTGHITGNIVIAIAALIQHSPGVATKIIALPLFVVIVAVVTSSVEERGQTKSQLAMWFFIEALLLTGFMVGGMLILPHASLSSLSYIGIAMLPVSAMSIHNALSRAYMNQFPPSTVMTSNLTHLIIDIVSFAWGWKEPHPFEKRDIARKNIKLYGNVFVGFLIGGGIAAVGYVFISYWTVSLPILLLIAMAIKSLD